MSKVVEIALVEIGNSESPANSNKQKYGAWYGMNGVAWCAQFVSWCYDKAGMALPHIDTDKGFHYCPSAYNYFLKNKLVVTHPEPGDIVLFSWKQDGKQNHTGIFKCWIDELKGTFESIEGNTAIGDDSNGGQVMLRKRNKSVATFARIK